MCFSLAVTGQLGAVLQFAVFRNRRDFPRTREGLGLETCERRVRPAKGLHGETLLSGGGGRFAAGL